MRLITTARLLRNAELGSAKVALRQTPTEVDLQMIQSVIFDIFKVLKAKQRLRNTPNSVRSQLTTTKGNI